MAHASYFDDSGTHAPSNVAVFGGYLGSEEEWTAFEGPWQELVAKVQSRTGKDHYHASKCCSGYDEYELIELATREAWHNQAVGIIEASPLIAIGVAVATLDFRATYFEARPGQVQVEPYEVCVENVLLELGEYVSTLWPEDDIQVFIEGRNRETTQRIRAIYADMMASTRWSGSVPRFVTEPVDLPKRFSQVQAADLVAYELFREMNRRLGAVPLLGQCASQYERLLEHAVAMARAGSGGKAYSLIRVMRIGPHNFAPGLRPAFDPPEPKS